MLTIFLNTLQAMAVLFIFMLFGYFFSKKKIVGDEAANVLSKVCVNIFVPAIGFDTMAKYCTKETLMNAKWHFVSGLVLLAVTVVFAVVFSRIMTKNRDTRNIYTYALVCPNYGYIGYPVVVALMGELALFDFMIFTMPFMIYTYSVAIQLLKPNGKVSLKGFITSSTTIAMAVGMVCGLTGMTEHIPAFIMNFTGSASNCMTPVGMVLAGIIIGHLDTKQFFKGAKSYIMAGVRLLGLPLLGILVFKLIGLNQNIAIMGVLFLSLPAGLNTIVFPAAYHGDSESGARIVFFTNLLGIITIPLMVALATVILK